MKRTVTLKREGMKNKKRQLSVPTKDRLQDCFQLVSHDGLIELKKTMTKTNNRKRRGFLFLFMCREKPTQTRTSRKLLLSSFFFLLLSSSSFLSLLISVESKTLRGGQTWAGACTRLNIVGMAAPHCRRCLPV